MNPFNKLLEILPSTRVDVGTVMAVYTDGVLVTLQGGGTTRVRGSANVGAHVYIRDGAIEGPAPALAGDTLEVG